MVASQSARKAGLPPMNINKAMNLGAAAQGRNGRPKPKKKPRPEWGTGHAGGARLKKDVRIFAPMGRLDEAPPMVRV